MAKGVSRREKWQTRESIHYSFMPNHRETMLALARARFTNQEYRVVIALMNQTDGYLREEDNISTSFWQTITLMSTESLLHTLKRLIARGVVRAETRDNKRFYGMNHPNEWPPGVFAPQRLTARALKEAEQLLHKEKEQQHFLWLKRLIEMVRTLSNQTVNVAKKSAKTDTNPVQPDRVVQLDTFKPQIQTLSNQTAHTVQPDRVTVQPDRVTVQPDSKLASKNPPESTKESIKESTKESIGKLPQPASETVWVDSDATQSEKRALKELRDIKNWPFNFKKDLDYLRKIQVDFPSVDVLGEVPRFSAYQLDHPISKNRGSPRLRLRHWIEKSAEFTDRREHHGARQHFSKLGRGAGPERSTTDEDLEASWNRSNPVS